MAESLLSLTMRSIYISASASLLAFAFAILISIASSKKPKKVVDMISGIFEALVGIPTTAVGLLIYMLLYPGGPLGFLKLLYTPFAIIIGEIFVALPIAVTSLLRDYYSIKEYIRELVLSLGGPEKKIPMLAFKELSPVLISSYLMSFSRSIGELGVALVVGGAIEGYTNVLTTAIAVQTSIGNYNTAIWIGLILISITVAIVLALKIIGAYLLWK